MKPYTTDRPIDLLCMGRAAVDLYAEQITAPLENASTLSKYVGGCPANIAIGASRLGLRTAMLTRVGDEAMGRFVKATLQSEGVDTTLVTVDPDRLTGLVLLGVNPPDNFPLIFYRENCADMAIDTNDFCAENFDDVSALLITGTHFSTDLSAATTREAVRLAKAAGTRVILDVDYRPVLWNLTGHGDGEERYIASECVHKALATVLDQCDLIVGTEEEICIVSAEDDIDTALKALRKASNAVIVEKCGERGCVVHGVAKDPITHPGFPVEVLNVLGAGDAFMSGFLRGWLTDESPTTCCAWANGAGALVVRRHGCAPAMPYWEELRGFVDSNGFVEEEALEHQHRMLGRTPQTINPLTVLAFDHRSHFEEVAKRHGRDANAIATFKGLIYRGVEQTSHDRATLGVIIDGKYGTDVLRGAVNDPSRPWVAQCIEEPATYPLRFLGGREASDILRTWPRGMTVKVLVAIPDQGGLAPEIKPLKHLAEACAASGHELLVEIVPQFEEGGDKIIIEALESCYRSEVRPTWWKLPLFQDRDNWREVQRLIEKNDPFCRGVLVLGRHLPIEEFLLRIEDVWLMPGLEVVKGFAVGRSVWAEVAEKWFAGSVEDDVVVSVVKERYERCVRAWAGPSGVVAGDGTGGGEMAGAGAGTDGGEGEMPF